MGSSRSRRVAAAAAVVVAVAAYVVYGGIAHAEIDPDVLLLPQPDDRYRCGSYIDSLKAVDGVQLTHGNGLAAVGDVLFVSDEHRIWRIEQGEAVAIDMPDGLYLQFINALHARGDGAGGYDVTVTALGDGVFGLSRAAVTVHHIAAAENGAVAAAVRRSAAVGDIFFTNAMQRNLDHLLHRMHPDDEIGLFLDTQRDGSVQRLATSGTAEREDVEEGGEDGTPPPTTTLRGSMWLPNGLALDGDERYLVVGEAHANRVVRIALDGGDADRVLLPNLPGFAEQITRDETGKFWLALSAPRKLRIEALAPYPALKQLIHTFRSVLPFVAQWLMHEDGWDDMPRLLHFDGDTGDVLHSICYREQEACNDANCGNKRQRFSSAVAVGNRVYVVAHPSTQLRYFELGDLRRA